MDCQYCCVVWECLPSFLCLGDLALFLDGCWSRLLQSAAADRGALAASECTAATIAAMIVDSED